MGVKRQKRYGFAEPSARFWAWVNGGWVKITLRPGQKLGVSGGGSTDEGYHFWAVSWEHDGEGVVRESSAASLDCDGRLDDGQDDYCPLAELASWEALDGMMVPDWGPVRNWKRDYAAEAAGY